MTAFKLSKIRPVESLTQVDKIEITLREYFRSENFSPGDAIPKETELAQAMGVSRTAIREAIARFKTLGIIESRKNRGMILTQPDILNNMQRLMDPQLLHGDTMKEIFEMRLVIEIGLADILFLRKTEEGLNKLEKIDEKEEKTIGKAELLKCDVEFHSMLYEISQNETIQRFQKMLLPIFDYMNDELHIQSQIPDKEYATHRVLLNVLKNGTPEEFRTKMKRHLLNYFEKV